jgi:hypothetical protein
MRAINNRTVRVLPTRTGVWEITHPESGEPVVCGTLHEARVIAQRHASHRPPCDVIVFDAYHRVLQRVAVEPATA